MPKKAPMKDISQIPVDAAPRPTPQSLPAMTGPGVEVPRIPVLDKLISKYEAEKEKRCQASPGELAAKKELQFALHQQKASLPVNSDGFAFYRSEDYERDYILVETMKAKKHASVEDDE